jgi:hypothetical protein
LDPASSLHDETHDHPPADRSRLQSAVCFELEWAPNVTATHVTFTGKVHPMAERRQAIATAGSAIGVTTANSHLIVND